MKDIAKSLLVAGAVIGASNVTAMDFTEINPYLGAEYEWSRMKGAGANRLDMMDRVESLSRFYPKSYSGANFFVGSRWCDFGAEIGYMFTGKKSKTQHRGTQRIQDNAFEQFDNFSSDAFGFLGTGDALKTTVKLNGFHLDFAGYMPVCDCWELIGTLGYGWEKAKVTIRGTHLGANVTAGLPVAESLRIHSKYKGMFRLGVGTQYMITDCVGVRGMIRWKNTEKLCVKIRNANPNAAIPFDDIAFKPFKDTISLAVGAFVKF